MEIPPNESIWPHLTPLTFKLRRVARVIDSVTRPDRLTKFSAFKVQPYLKNQQKDTFLTFDL